MPPMKAAPTKNNNPPPRGAPNRGNKGGTGKKAKEKRKERKLNLKGWLETKADWAKFDAWAQINAQPRKIPEPEPVVRPSKPLFKLKKRIVFLSKPQKRPDIGKTCRSDMRVSKKALTAKPSRRIIQLAMFVVKEEMLEPCRELPVKIHRAALSYRPTKRIIEISRPKLHFSEYCTFLATCQSKQTTERDKRLALAKKAIQCPDLMTDDEINILMTPTGIYRSALSYKITEWMAYLALPSYRFLKEQTDEKAEEWKKFILEESAIRGKKALEYKKKKKKSEKIIKPEEEVRRVEEKEDTDATNDDDYEKQSLDVASQNEEILTQEKTEEEGEPNETNEPDNTNEDSVPKDNEEAEVEPKPVSRINQNEMTPVDEDEAAKQRKAERNAWRFVPSPCKENPFEIKKSALNAKASPRMEQLAMPNVHVDRSCRPNPFAVRKSALEGPAVPERITELAKSPHPRDPVERPPPRDKDNYGRPVFPKPPYGKKMPRVKMYQEAECPDKDGKSADEEEKKKKEDTGRRVIDPIVYEATIDPLIDPERARRQLKARKAAKEEIERRKKPEETVVNQQKEPRED